MNRNSWTRYLVAAALILLAGAVWSLAGEEKELNIQVKNLDGQEITVDVNGVKETIHLDDLAPGEEREIQVGEHPITIRRVDDQLTLVHEGLHGSAAAFSHEGEGHGQTVWVTKGDEGSVGHRFVIMKKGDGKTIDVELLGDHLSTEGNVMFLGDDEHGEVDVFVVKGEDGEIDIEALKEKYGDELIDIHEEGDHHVMRWVEEGDGDHPIIIKRMGHVGGGDFVVYRCEETGSMLTVKADDNLLDDYLDPVTGCVMKRVEEGDAQVITIRKAIKKDCELKED
jgi:hypothetical protein